MVFQRLPEDPSKEHVTYLSFGNGTNIAFHHQSWCHDERRMWWWWCLDYEGRIQGTCCWTKRRKNQPTWKVGTIERNRILQWMMTQDIPGKVGRMERDYDSLHVCLDWFDLTSLPPTKISFRSGLGWCDVGSIGRCKLTSFTPRLGNNSVS